MASIADVKISLDDEVKVLLKGFVSSVEYLKTKSHAEDVRDFQEKFGQLLSTDPRHLTQRKLMERWEFLNEELEEFRLAVDTQDLAGQADALVDLVYVALGTANMLGLPWQDLWEDVHRANMAKERGVGKRGHLVDCIKPPGWKGPRTEDILREHGYVGHFPQLEADDPEHRP